MLDLFTEVRRASLPPTILGALAELRAIAGVTVLIQESQLWLQWDSANDAVLKVLLPLPGVHLYVRREGVWYRFGASLPAFEMPPDGIFRPLHDHLFPAPVLPIPALPRHPFCEKVTVRLVPEDRPRSTSGLLVSLKKLLSWMEGIPTARLKALKAATWNGMVLVLGPRLPFLESGRRYWGEQVLRPLGFRAEPDLPESDFREALEMEGEDLLLLGEESVEVIPGAAFGPLTRAGVRRAARRAPA